MIAGDYAYGFWRYLSIAGALAIFLGAGAFIMATLPPRELVMATGAEGSANYELGIRYREILAKEGVRLQLQPTSGSLENLKYLRDPRSRVSVGFIQGGTTSRSARSSTSRYGCSAEARLEKAYRRCAADDFRSVPKEAAGAPWRCK
jgi:TRAP-type uncharacterized transport system substrate-binding protein